MNKQYKLKNAAGKYFVSGEGWTGTEQSASVLDEATIKCLAGAGFTGTSVEVKNKSYAAVYIRKTDKVSLTGVSKLPGKIELNQLDPSSRRFATFEEAAVHAGRFYTRRARKTDPVGSGTAGHIGAFVIETNDPVNARINPVTKLTNSI